MISEKEIRETFDLHTDEDDIIHLVNLNWKKSPAENVLAIKMVAEEIQKIFDKNPSKKYSMLVDMKRMGNFKFGFSWDVRKASAQIVLNKQLNKIAYINPSLFIKTVIGFIAASTGKGKYVKQFSTEEEALKWLKED